jgi:hypothetical protein
MTVAFAAMVPNVSPFLPGCPNLVVENSLRRKARELCSFARVWRHELPPVAMNIGQPSYTLASPFLYAEILSIVSGTVLVDTRKSPLSRMPYADAQRLHPAWPENYSSAVPRQFVAREPRELWLLPVPSEAGTATLYVQLSPTVSAAEWEEPLYARYEQALLHGVLFELLAMPERAWTDQKEALNHGKLWSYHKAMARADAAGDFSSRGLTVQMTPFA